MRVYKVIRNQILPISLDRAWEFFATPKNLALITPSRMNFKILSISGGEKMHPGQIITYGITALPLVRVRWVTEITRVEEPTHFADDMVSGPFALWHHQHRFKATPGGVEMTDEVNYALPFGWLGQIGHALFVEREVKGIFDYRFNVLKDYFDSTPGTFD